MAKYSSLSPEEEPSSPKTYEEFLLSLRIHFTLQLCCFARFLKKKTFKSSFSEQDSLDR
jgi:hypothetical protein